MRGALRAEGTEPKELHVAPWGCLTERESHGAAGHLTELSDPGPPGPLRSSDTLRRGWATE